MSGGNPLTIILLHPVAGSRVKTSGFLAIVWLKPSNTSSMRCADTPKSRSFSVTLSCSQMVRILGGSAIAALGGFIFFSFFGCL